MMFPVALMVAVVVQAAPAQASIAPEATVARHVLALPAHRAGEPYVGSGDQASDGLIVRNVRPGARVELYANGRFVGSAIARGEVVRVQLQHRLRPGTKVTATVRDAGAVFQSEPAPITIDYTTYHFDTVRSGWNPYETTLNTANVASGSFGPLFNLSVDGNVYGQPLYVSQLTMPDESVHNVLYVTTTNNTVYAFDADTGATLWQRSFIDTKHGIYNVTAANVDNHNVWPTVGIASTPVIDRSADSLFIVTAIRLGQGPNAVFEHQLHALVLETGLDQADSPITIGWSVQMTNGDTATFQS